MEIDWNNFFRDRKMEKPLCTFRKQVQNHNLTAYNKLRRAIRSKNQGLVQKLVDEGVTVNGIYGGRYKEFDPADVLDEFSRINNPLFSPLHLAVMSRDAEIVKILLDKDADVNAKVGNGDTPLTMAAKMQSTTITDLLLAHDSLKDAWNFDNLTHLHIACMRDNVKVVQKLLLMNQGKGIDECVYEEISPHWAGWTPLHFAVHYECVETVRFLLSCGANITLLDERQCSPLHLAHIHRNEKIIDLLLEAHKNEFTNPSDSRGLSHFHIACTRDDASVVEHFLKTGVDINCQVKSSPEQGWGPMHFAMLYECYNVIELLLKHKVQLESPCGSFLELLGCAYFMEDRSIYNLFLNDNIGLITAKEECQKLLILRDACIQNQASKVEEMLQNNLISIPSDLNRPILNGLTTVHLAVKHKSQSVLEVLLGQGASLVAQDSEGRTPLHLALKDISSFTTGFQEYCVTLSVNVTDNEGLSMFHVLCALGCIEAIKNFLLHGVDVNSQVGSDSAFYAGFTPLHFAVKYSKIQVADILLEHGADILLTNNMNLNPFDLAIVCMSNNEYFDDLKTNLEMLVKILLHAYEKHIQLNHRGLSILHGLSTFANTESEQFEQYLTTHRDEIDRTIEFPPWLGYTPLHVATICFHRYDLAELLLKNGANPSIVNGTGNTFIEGAFLFGIPRGESVKEIDDLFDSVADIEGLKPSYFHLACDLGLLQHLVESISRGIDDPQRKLSLLNSCNDFGQTPLHSFMLLETDEERDEITKLLLENGADFHAKDFELQTPLHYAQIEIEPNVTQTLIDHGADLNAQNIFGQTPLHKLLQNIREKYTGRYSSLHLFYRQIISLLDGGSDINISDKRGLTPLMIIPHSNVNQLWEGIAGILLEHVQKLQVINYHIDDDNKRAYTRLSNSLSPQNFDETSFVETCKRELAVMQNEYIDHYTTLFNILFKSRNCMAVHCENISLQNMVQSTEFIREYPLYGFLIKSQVKNGQIRRALLYESKKSLDLIFGTSLPGECMNIILDHLSDKDLGNILRSR